MSGYPAVIELSDLDGSNGFQINGEAANDYSGFSVASAGDVNGDGFDDLIVGAWGADPNGAFSGASYVVFGKASSFGAELELSSLEGSNGFQINGEAAYDASGRSVASAGDVNGDGFDDLIVGAYRAGPNGSLISGASYVVFGKASGFGAELELPDLDGFNGFRINGEATGDFSGISVSTAGDINGDGFDDLIVGASRADPNGDFSGASYLVYGKASGFDAELELSVLDGSNGFQINGETAFDACGWAVSSAGDVNGDGFDDLIVGAYGADLNGNYSGASYVVFGKASSFGAELELSDLDGSNGFQINGEAAYDWSGLSVASDGDVNGDGFDDLIVGAKSADPNGYSSGASYVVFGKASGFGAELELSDLDGSNGFQINGEAAYDFSGRSVTSAGDFNGDGFDDLIVGAYGAEPNGNYSGASYLVFGKASGFDAELELSNLDGSNGIQINGDAGEFSGFSVSSAGDVNGDGFYDLIIGAAGAGPNGYSSGASYVIYGSAPGESVERIGSVIGQTIRGGAFGDTLSGLGGDDILFGGQGDDLLLGGDGDDVLRGGGGFDVASFAAAGQGVTVDLGVSGLQTTGEGEDFLGGIEGLIGSAFDDRLTGDNRRNLLDGGDGADTLTGGGNGDTLIGGLGADVFVFNKLADSSPRRDRISDLEDGDIIDLSAIDADTSTLDDDAFTLVRQFTGHAGEARIGYSVKRDISFLNLDVDGDGHADMTIILDGNHRGFEGFVL